MQINFLNNYNNQNFGLRNPKAAMNRAQKLKEAYNKQGLDYLLPNETWSSKKILQTVQDFGKIVDELYKNKKMNPENLKKEIDKLLPEKMHNKFSINDFKKVYEKPIKQGIPKKVAKKFYRCASAMIRTNDNNTYDLFLKFPNIFSGKDRKNTFKTSVCHETKHLLSSLFENVKSNEKFKNPKWSNLNYRNLSSIFNKFYIKYCFDVDKIPAEYSKNSLLKKLSFKNIQEMHKDFDKNFYKSLEKSKKAEDFKSLSPQEKRNCYEYFKNCARDEKEAYTTTKFYREMIKENSPTEGELRIMLFEELEKYFADKMKKV